jgi:hypothetical protein
MFGLRSATSTSRRCERIGTAHFINTSKWTVPVLSHLISEGTVVAWERRCRAVRGKSVCKKTDGYLRAALSRHFVARSEMLLQHERHGAAQPSHAVFVRGNEERRAATRQDLALNFRLDHGSETMP